jgi:uncharacterized protein
MRFTVLPERLAICRLAPNAAIPDWATRGEFSSVTRAPKELSIICEDANVPTDTKAERDFFCIQLEGPFDFQATGILSAFIAPLAEHRVPIFALSTYDTDWVLIRARYWDTARSVLLAAGNELVS